MKAFCPLFSICRLNILQKERESNSSYITLNKNMSDGEAITTEYKKMCCALISGDIHALKRYFKDSIRYLNGEEQSVENWLNDIKEGNIKYFEFDVEDEDVQVHRNKAELFGMTIMDASIYGVRKKWYLPSKSKYQREKDGWHMIPGTVEII